MDMAAGEGAPTFDSVAIIRQFLSFMVARSNASSGVFNDTAKIEIMEYVTNLTAHIGTECFPRHDLQPPDCAPTHYCNDGPLRRITASYRAVHGYVSIAICAFGVVSNLLNVAVLTRKDMASAPINRILTGLAVTDLLVTLEYVPFSCYMYVALPKRQEFTYPWAVYMLFHAYFTQVLHTISICITLTLAVWRYIAIRYPERNRTLCTQRRCHAAIGVSYGVAVIVCAPNYVASEIRETCIMEVHPPHVGFILVYHVGPSNELLHRVNFWVYSVVIKLLPCIILTVMSCWLIKALYRVNQSEGENQSKWLCSVSSVLFTLRILLNW